jgi:TonB family protein
MAATTERAALPDLQVEVMAGNQRKQLAAKNNNAIRVDLSSSSSTPGTQVRPEDMISSSASHAQVSEQTAQTVNRPVAPDYPLLARQMRVQGAVILQALISKEGTIQELQILSGPAILANAAREAVRQWHFKPYLQDGQPIETQARITVNFTISTN